MDFFQSGFVSDWHKLVSFLKIDMQSTHGLLSHLGFDSFIHSATTVDHLLFVWHYSRYWGDRSEQHRNKKVLPLESLYSGWGDKQQVEFP